MVACAGPEGTRCALHKREFTIRCGARILEQRELAAPVELLDILAGYFDLPFPAGTQFGELGSR